jgi:transcriptional regulator with XRE-family HTH domain
MPISGSTVMRRQLGRWLRQLRHAAGKTEVDVEEASVASRVKLWRIETGKVLVKTADARMLCWLYGADAGTTDTLGRLASATKDHGWWEDYEITPKRYGLYLALEGIAESLEIYDPEKIHPLLQTPGYMRVLHLAAHPDATEPALQRHLELGLERQKVLMRTPSLRMTAIVGEGALSRVVGGTAIMTEQVDWLRGLTRQHPHIDIQVLPWQAGAHPAMQAGPFTILSFSDANDPAVVHVETHTGARYLERSSELTEYRRVFARIYGQAVPISEFLVAQRLA